MMTLWVDAFETLAIFGIVTVLFYSVYTEPKYKLQSCPETLQDNQPGDVDTSVSTMDRVGAELEGSINTSESTNPASQPPASAFKAISNKVDFTPTFSKCFISYGLFIGAFAILDFIADVLRLMNWHVFGHLSMAMNVIVGIVFLPIWLLIFAKQLPEATSRFERTQRWEGMIGNGDDETSGLMRKGEAA
ncbi:hypothetical protein HJC23_006215 [Cyclotella cryptica]|uniref:Uncharacterized protein n=1 Tax=Cyclotella cryptica TaxID=29204 RepID=A0ABD3PWI4_9STRA